MKRKGCKIETLSLTQNKISVKGALQLAQGLCFNKSIKILELSRNQLGAKGCYLLSEALRESTTSNVQSLDLSYNDIGNTGAHCLATLIAQTRIVELRIQGNSISDDGLNSLFNNLTGSGLKILDVSQNVV